MGMKSPLEAGILKACLEYLALKKIPAWRQNSGAVVSEYKGKKRLIRYGQKGASDAIGLLPPSGRMLALETKRPGEKLRPEQQAWLENIRKAGGLVIVAHSVAELEQQLREAGYG